MAAPDLGMMDATPGALAVLQLAEPFELFNRHASGDWGEVSAEDATENERAAREGARVVSCYQLDGRRLQVHVVTEADRSATTIMLPEEYQRSLDPPEPPLPGLPQWAYGFVRGQSEGRRMADVEAMIADLAQLDREDLRRLMEALRRRMQELPGGGEEPAQYRPDVLEYRPYEDGHLQLETRTYYRRDGSKKTHGPYWYYRFHEGGKQKKIYLGKTDNPEAKLQEKRGAPNSSL